MADQFLFGGKAQPSGGCAGGDDYGAGVHPFIVDPQTERAHRKVGIGNGCVQVFRAEILRLQLHILDEIGAVDALGKAGEILHEGGKGELAAGFVSCDHERFQIGAGGINGGGISGAARTYDNYISHRKDQCSIGLKGTLAASGSNTNRRRIVIAREETMRAPKSTACTGLLLLTLCLAYGQTVEKPSFDAAYIKPHVNAGGGRPGDGPLQGKGSGGLRFTPGRVVSAPIGVTARKILMEAYHLNQYQLSGGPGWLDSYWFDLEGKTENPADENQLRQMLQTLLAERLQLVAHRETKEMPVYALMVGKNGPKLHEWKPGDPTPASGNITGTMQHFAEVLSNAPDVGRPVLDKTGMQGVYGFFVQWPADGEFLPAMQEQLGLKLESQKGPVDILIIDHLEKPSSN